MEWNVVWFVGSLAGGLLASAIGVEWVRGSQPKSESEHEQEARMRRLEELARASRCFVPSCDFQRTKELERRALDAQEALRRRTSPRVRLGGTLVSRPPAALGRNA